MKKSIDMKALSEAMDSVVCDNLGVNTPWVMCIATDGGFITASNMNDKASVASQAALSIGYLLSPVKEQKEVFERKQSQ